MSVNSIEVNTVGSIYKLVLSLLLGAVIGYERKRKGQTAGVRTFSLIAMGMHWRCCCPFMSLRNIWD